VLKASLLQKIAKLSASLLKKIAKLAISCLMPGRKVFVFSGLRRSGNHAIIHWVMNGLESQSTEYHSVGPFWFSVSGSGKTVFLNNVNMVPPQKYLKALFEYRKYLSDAEQILISCEDNQPLLSKDLVQKVGTGHRPAELEQRRNNEFSENWLDD